MIESQGNTWNKYPPILSGQAEDQLKQIRNYLMELTDWLRLDRSRAYFLAAHPVGSIYVTSDENDPSKKYGGAWEQTDVGSFHGWLRKE